MTTQTPFLSACDYKLEASVALTNALAIPSATARKTGPLRLWGLR
jgi:hypothetical protein